MAVTDASLKVKYTGNGVAKVFTYGFKIFAKTDIYVGIIDNSVSPATITQLAVDTDFSLTGVGSDSGGTVTYPLSGSAIPSTKQIVIKPSVSYVQELVLSNQSDKPIEIALDKLSTQIKQVAEELDRAVKLTDATEDSPEDVITAIYNAQSNNASAIAAAAAAAASQAAAAVSASNAQAWAASVNLPSITGQALKALRVNASGTAYELYTVAGGGTGVLKDMNIGNGLQDDGSGNLTIKLNGTTLQCGASGLQINGSSVGDPQLLSTGVVAGTYTNATITVTSKGRITSASSGISTGLLIGYQIFTTSGSYSKGANNPSSVIVEMVGGGGGGGGNNSTSNNVSAGGGGAGGYSRKRILASSLGAIETVTVGSGGSGPASGTSNGGTGGTSSFGAHCSATGGSGGVYSTNGSGALGGSGGAGSGGDLNLTGEPGRSGMYHGTAASAIGGNGGSTMFGGSGRGSTGAGGNAVANSGSGGPGMGANATTGAIAGGSGMVIVWEYA